MTYGNLRVRLGRVRQGLVSRWSLLVQSARFCRVLRSIVWLCRVGSTTFRFGVESFGIGARPSQEDLTVLRRASIR